MEVTYTAIGVRDEIRVTSTEKESLKYADHMMLSRYVTAISALVFGFYQSGVVCQFNGAVCDDVRLILWVPCTVIAVFLLMCCLGRDETQAVVFLDRKRIEKKSEAGAV